MFDIKDGTLRKDGEHGFFSGIFNEDYHNGDEVSSSRLQTLIDCPEKYNDVRKPSTPSQEFGTMFHSMFLETKMFYTNLHVMENENKRTTLYKNEKNEAIASGKTNFLTKTEYDNLYKMKAAAEKHPQFKPLFSGGHAEISVYGEIDGVSVKCRPDYMSIDQNGSIYIVDLKTSLSCLHSDLEMSISKYAYHRQAAFYIDLVKQMYGKSQDVHFVNYFVESTRVRKRENGDMNNHISVVAAYIPPEDIEQGRREYHKAIENFKRMNDEGFVSYDGFNDVIYAGIKQYRKDKFNQGECITEIF